MREDTALAVQERGNVFLAFDRLDDDQIIQEMKGAALTEYVYEFSDGSQTVRGLSKTGTDDASRIMAVKYGEALREIDCWLEREDDQAGYFKAKVGRYIIKDDGTAIEMDTAIGHKRQPKVLVLKNGATKPNPFWYEQGGQKAIRNAKQKLMPETIKQAIIAAYVEQGKVRRLDAEDVVEVSVDDKAEAQHWCSVHNVAFKKYEKDGRTWYSHRLDDGSYCNERKSGASAAQNPAASASAQPSASKGEPKRDELKKRWAELWNQAMDLGMKPTVTLNPLSASVEEMQAALKRLEDEIAAFRQLKDGKSQ